MIIVATPSQVTILPAAFAAEKRAGLTSSLLFIAPLALPAETDLIDLVAIADPRTPWPRQMRHTSKPTVVLIGDDPGTPDGHGGPDSWRCSCKIGGWARAVISHGAGGEAAHYEAVVHAAQQLGRVVLIETTSRHAKGWAERIGCARTCLILPTAGQHPTRYGETLH